MHKNTLLCKEKYYNRVIAKKKSANLADFFNTSMSQDPKLYVWIQTEQRLTQCTAHRINQRGHMQSELISACIPFPEIPFSQKEVVYAHILVFVKSNL